MDKKEYILVVYSFSPADEDVEELKFATESELLKYVEESVASGRSCLYFHEKDLPFKNGWDELQSSSHLVFD